MNLLDHVTNLLNDRDVTALAIETELEPIHGRGAAICPPTYASRSSEATARFAYSEAAPMPQRADSGWYEEIVHNDQGAKKVPRVIINSIGAEAGAVERALYYQQQRLGVVLPAIKVDGSKNDPTSVARIIDDVTKKSSITDALKRQIIESLNTTTSNWELAHRHVDAWIKYADDGDGQIWAGDGDLKRIIQAIGHRDGETTFRNAPNAAMFGSWLSSGTPIRQAIPRAYSSEIIGFNALPITRGSTKLDVTGGASSSSKVKPKAGGVEVAASGKRPSQIGFGQMPSDPIIDSFACELILRQSSLSLRALERFQYVGDDTDAKSLAARRVYVLLVMAGHVLAGDDLFLRSGCDLVNVGEQWGWRRRGKRSPELMATPSLGEISEALQQALSAAQDVGLTFAQPVSLAMSDAELKLVTERMVAEAHKIDVTEGADD